MAKFLPTLKRVKVSYDQQNMEENAINMGVYHFIASVGAVYIVD